MGKDHVGGSGIERLRCEGRVNPLGVDQPRPTLSWWLSSAEDGVLQQAYELQAATSHELLRSGAPDLHQGGWQDSSLPEARSPFSGFTSRQTVYWRVRVRYADATISDWSEPASFEMGLLSRTDWSGSQPISGSELGTAEHGAPAPLLRTEFELAATPIRARLYITALGEYSTFLNAQPVTDGVLRPGWTEYGRRLLYDTLDVLPLLQHGTNALAVTLGDGWYCGHIGETRQVYGAKPVLLCRLELDHADGTRQSIGSDPSWRFRSGPIVSNDHYMGEHHDDRFAPTGWRSPGFDDSTWTPANAVTTTMPELTCSSSPPVRALAAIDPISTSAVPGGWRYDFGQNLAGRLRVVARGSAGTTVALRHAEMLEADGSLHTRNLGIATATDSFVLTDDHAAQEFEPSFTFHGFRYAELTTSTPLDSAPEVTAIALSSDLEPASTFECSDLLVNQLMRNIVWSQRSNAVDLPTDCPQRAERLGWTGDVHAFAATAASNFDVSTFYAKWLADLRAMQFTTGPQRGEYPITAPGQTHWGGGPGWADAALTTTALLYDRYGDTGTLEQMWPSLKEWASYLERVDQGDVPDRFKGFGDWLSLDADPAHPLGPDTRWGGTSLDLLELIHHARAFGELARLSEPLHDSSFQRRMVRLRAAGVEVLRSRYLSAGRLEPFTQTGAVLLLAYDLLDEQLRNAVAQQLVDDLEHWGHLRTGFLGTPHLLPALSAIGRTDLAYRLLERTECPSWLYPVTQGATTMWERWDAWSPEEGFHPAGMNSFNHYAYGSVGDWIHSTIGGITIGQDGPGAITIRPRPGGTITWAIARRLTRWGWLDCSWRTTPSGLTLELVVPAGATARVQLDEGGIDTVVGSGKHTFTATS